MGSKSSFERGVKRLGDQGLLRCDQRPVRPPQAPRRDRLCLAALTKLLGCSGSIAGVLAGAGLWGLHMALSQGLLAAMVADAAPAALRGTAFGLFNLVSGAALFLASLLAGSLWASYGSAATFLCGAALSAVALVGLLVLVRRDA